MIFFVQFSKLDFHVKILSLRLTPKLLNGLEFNERVTVHIVHNGPEIEHGDVSFWDGREEKNSKKHQVREFPFKTERSHKIG